jgi:Ca2+-binding EF-hand superfamily protein
MIITSATEKITLDEVDKLLEIADADKDGKILLAEWVSMMTPKPPA